MLHNRTSSSLPPSFPRLLATAFSPPLLPFSLRPFLLSLSIPPHLFFPRSSSELSDLNLREVRRVIAFLLERLHALTPSATMELVSLLASIVGALELRMPAVAALLKVQFSGLLYCYDPILCHVVLMLYSRFSDAFTGDDELGIARRLALIPKEAHQPLFIRLLAIHWLLGSSQLSGKQGFFPSLMHCFYPTVFDPLSLKASKLDVLSSFAAYLDDTPIERDLSSQEGQKKDGDDTVAKFFEEGLVCLSAFKWLSPSSSETTLFFRTLHKFLIGVSPHHDSTEHAVDSHVVFYSSTFKMLQRVLVELALAHCKLVPMIVSFIDRLFECKAHQLVGEHLFQTLNEQLLPKLEIGFLLVSYFPLFERIASNDSIPPRGLVELLLKHVVYLTEKHGPETSLRSWSQGSKVLGICRTMLMHHHSSRIFLTLSQLLGFTCQFFPDLEVRDTARIYLRMLLCIPGKKLKTIMDFDGQLTGMSPSPHPASLFQVLSPMQFQDPRKLSSISSYIHLERAIPPLVKQSWSLVLPNFEINENKTTYFEGNRDVAISSMKIEKEAGVTTDRIGLQEEPLRVMDSKVAETLRILRMHFACIPDYKNMPGTKIRIPCVLWFKAESFNRVWESDSPTLDSDVVDNLPALYATTINFKSTAKYGSIPACHIPFLLGEPSNTGLDIVPVGCDIQEDSSFRASLVIELEPREPMPGIIDTELKANIEKGTNYFWFPSKHHCGN
ncbi:hypothetical protein HPP92_012853 [Vanilla planifolia]|uniref:AP5B1 middle domain-containing protein n=1 Tax=Vanilla planifolia TaxID=51239 RepID=A0A835QWG2_VANPL|nr:hypothetical protein HPP92_012853 [Vanilla planifolia]